MSISTTYLLNVALHATILAIFANLFLTFLRRPGQRSFIAIAGLLAVGILPWITPLREVPAPTVQPVVTEIRPEPAELPVWTIATVPMENLTTNPPAPFTPAIAKRQLPDPLTSLLVLWAAGTSIALTALGIAWVKVTVWRKSLTSPNDAAWLALQSLDAEIPARRDFRICDDTASPCVIGLWRPQIILPRFLLDGGSADALRWAVRHEIGHWQANDSRWMLLFAVIRCVNWWNPFVHRLVAIWADAREQLCDLHASGDSDNRANYGEFLIAMARRVGKQPPLAVAMAKRPHAKRLKQRIVSLLDSSVDGVTPVGRGFVGISSGLFVCVAVLVSVLKIGAEEAQIVSGGASVGEDAQRTIVEPEAEKLSPPVQMPLIPGVDESKPSASASPPTQDFRQLKISTKFILTSSGIGAATEKIPGSDPLSIHSMLSQGQVKLIFKGLAQTKDCRLMTCPSVTSKSGQKSTLEIVREVIGSPDQIAKRDPNSDNLLVGIMIDNLPHFIDEAQAEQVISTDPAGSISTAPVAVEMEQTVDYRYVPGLYQPIAELGGPASSDPKRLNPDEIKSIKRTIKGRFFSGYTVWTDLGEIEPGKYLSFLTRIDVIDANGVTLGGSEGRFPDTVDEEEAIRSRERLVMKLYEMMPPDQIPSAEVKGRVRISGTQIDLPRDPTLPEDVRNWKQLISGNQDALDALAKYYKLEKRQLKSVVIPTNQRRVPWPELPGINLSALLSKKFGFIALSNDSKENGASTMPGMESGSMAMIDVASGDPSIERRVYIKVEIVK